jgi:hypothetical protein
LLAADFRFRSAGRNSGTHLYTCGRPDLTFDIAPL